jgi:hypothetical protein
MVSERVGQHYKLGIAFVESVERPQSIFHTLRRLSQDTMSHLWPAGMANHYQRNQFILVIYLFLVNV